MRALEETPRPYKVVFLSDHGQTAGGTFEDAWGLSFDKLVRNAVSRPVDIFTNPEVSEAWEKWQAALADEQKQMDQRTKNVCRCSTSCRCRFRIRRKVSEKNRH